MKKSVYSLVLMDDVVDAIDRLAYSMNTSRSNLINQILAERVSLATPEMRMQEIFRSVESLMADHFQILEQSSDAMFSIRSQLKYKYKPTIRYSLEIYRSPSDGIGRLKISFRTTSQSLVDALNSFFYLWNSIELRALRASHPSYAGISTDGTRFIREIQTPVDRPPLTGAEAGNAIACYIQMLDTMIQLYFANLDLAPAQMQLLLESRYRQFRSDPSFIDI